MTRRVQTPSTGLIDRAARSPAQAGHADRIRQAYESLHEDFQRWTPSPAFRKIFADVVIAEIVGRLRFTDKVRILEAGCGHGTWAEEIYKVIPNAHRRIEYVGIDFTEARIESARRRLSSNRSAIFNCADCELYEPDRRFDLILAIEVISHVPFDRHHDWFTRWRGWLCDGGSLVVIDKDRYSKHNLRLKWDTIKRRFLPRLIAGRSYYFSEDFADLVGTLDYPSFRRMCRIARSAGLVPRPIFEHGMFRAMTADRVK